MEINELLNYIGNIPLSGSDILNLLNNNTNVLTYPQLTKYDNIESLLYPYNSCIILYLTHKNYGHWTCLINHYDRIEFFDSYINSLPDSELSKINYDFRINSNQLHPHLATLLSNGNKNIEYNNYSFQKFNKNIKTCGYHCVSRIIFKNFLLDEYYNILKKLSKEYKLTLDNLAVFISLFL